MTPDPIAVVCFKWFDPNGRYNARFTYGAEHVNRLASMVRRHLPVPHNFTCITDDPEGLDPAVRFLPLDRDMLRKAGHRYPKLAIFRPDAAEWLGRRILLLDLDTVVVGDLGPIVRRPDDFVIWQDPAWRVRPHVGRYNSSMILLAAGARPKVWTRFVSGEGVESFAAAHTVQSDQAWIFHVLGDTEPVWTREQGAYSFKADLIRKPWFQKHAKKDARLRTRLPWRSRIVFLHGGLNPASPELQAQHPWIRRHWR